MIVLLAIAAWSLATLLIGLVTGDPFLRTGGVGVLCLSVGAAWLLDRLTPRREEPEVEDWVLIDLSDVDWSSWPDHREERAA